MTRAPIKYDRRKQRREQRLILQQIGANIHQARSCKRMTLIKLGRRAEILPSTLDLFELGRGELRVPVLNRIAQALDVPIEWLVRAGGE